eukprot:GHUV01016692.1.p1 GENE.GHUV01016692.1~~GHUV01016692.1.p1  ORF type:complete len:253 (-),score=46.17 GHUV01016692.1:242-1000(-)
MHCCWCMLLWQVPAGSSWRNCHNPGISEHVLFLQRTHNCWLLGRQLGMKLPSCHLTTHTIPARNLASQLLASMLCCRCVASGYHGGRFGQAHGHESAAILLLHNIYCSCQQAGLTTASGYALLQVCCVRLQRWLLWAGSWARSCRNPYSSQQVLLLPRGWPHNCRFYALLQVCRLVVDAGRQLGKKIVLVRHLMPYGDLARQAVQRFETLEDLDRHHTTIEEREEYEQHIKHGVVVYAGVVSKSWGHAVVLS